MSFKFGERRIEWRQTQDEVGMQFDDSAPIYLRHPARFFDILPPDPPKPQRPAEPKIKDYIKDALADA